jgi:hypothetical protein
LTGLSNRLFLFEKFRMTVVHTVVTELPVEIVFRAHF